jgi:hypothetical protein
MSMATSLVHADTPLAFFYGLVEDALERQRVRPREETTFYLVTLLAGFVNPQRPGAGLTDDPLAIRLASALQSGGTARREGLRRVGDLSLFVSGFFPDSLTRTLVDVDYYIAMGGAAYGSLGREGADARAATFAELADRFVEFVDVLTEVSEHTSSAPNSDVLRLYDRWMRTGSRGSGQRLVERGVLPVPATPKRRLIQ